MNLLDLPDCMLEQIFEYLSYDEIANKRLVSTKINGVCQQLLNRGYIKVSKRISKEVQKIRSIIESFSRRESKRSEHPLSSVARDLSMMNSHLETLSRTYNKYIVMHICCFIPGKALDEIVNVSRWLSNTRTITKHIEKIDAAEREIRDLSQMAVDHFEKHFQNKFQNILNIRNKSLSDQHNEIVPVVRKSSPKLATGQPPDTVNSQRAYTRLNKKYTVVMRKLNHVTSEVVELRRRLEELESKNLQTAPIVDHLATIEETKTSESKKRQINDHVYPSKKCLSTVEHD